MSNSLKQSMKQRFKSVAKERDLTFDEIWHNLILERFLARLCQSKYKSNFILKERNTTHFMYARLNSAPQKSKALLLRRWRERSKACLFQKEHLLGQFLFTLTVSVNL